MGSSEERFNEWRQRRDVGLALGEQSDRIWWTPLPTAVKLHCSLPPGGPSFRRFIDDVEVFKLQTDTMELRTRRT